jgi:hypothetical protein
MARVRRTLKLLPAVLLGAAVPWFPSCGSARPEPRPLEIERVDATWSLQTVLENPLRAHYGAAHGLGRHDLVFERTLERVLEGTGWFSTIRKSPQPGTAHCALELRDVLLPVDPAWSDTELHRWLGLASLFGLPVPPLKMTSEIELVAQVQSPLGGCKLRFQVREAHSVRRGDLLLIRHVAIERADDARAGLVRSLLEQAERHGVLPVTVPVR